MTTQAEKKVFAAIGIILAALGILATIIVAVVVFRTAIFGTLWRCLTGTSLWWMLLGLLVPAPIPLGYFVIAVYDYKSLEDSTVGLVLTTCLIAAFNCLSRWELAVSSLVVICTLVTLLLRGTRGESQVSVLYSRLTLYVLSVFLPISLLLGFWFDRALDAYCQQQDPISLVTIALAYLLAYVPIWVLAGTLTGVIEMAVATSTPQTESNNAIPPETQTHTQEDTHEIHITKQVTATSKEDESLNRQESTRRIRPMNGKVYSADNK